MTNEANVTSADATTEPTEAERKLAEIVERNRKGIELHDDYLMKAEEAKAAKKRWEAHQEATQRFIADLDRDYPLFDQPASQEPAAPAAADDWREVRLDTLGLSESILKHLAEAGLHTVGCVSDWTTSEKALTDVPGIGPASAETIEAALATFWASRPAAAESETDAAELGLDPTPRKAGEFAGDINRIEAGHIACNGCNLVRPATVQPCPACGNPEARRSQLDIEAEAAEVEAKPRKACKGKAVAS